MRIQKIWPYLALAVLLLAGCGEIPTARPGAQAPTLTPASYPPPPTIPTQPPQTPAPTPTPVPTPTPEGMLPPPPTLAAQAVPVELLKGERIAFLKDGNLWLVRPDGSALAQVTTSGNVSAIFGWSWDNSRLLLGVTFSGYPWLDLWVLSADGASTWQVTKAQAVVFASWSPVDLSLAYFTDEGQLYVVNLPKAEARQLERTLGIQESAWSPDGTRLAFLVPPSSWEPGSLAGSSDIAVWNLKDGTITRLTNTSDDPSKGWNYHPTWSMEGSTILFESERELVGNQFWYTMDNDGDNLRHLDTQPLLSALNVVRSPVADQVVMNVEGAVWLLDFDGRTRKIGDTVWPVRGPYSPYSWSSDGTRLVLVEAGGRLVQIDVSGQAVETIAETGANPAWTH